MPFLKLQEVEYVQIDHTSKCNLICPQCSRVSNGQRLKSLPLIELNVDDYKKIFNELDLSKINNVVLCGNYGDVIASKSILDCLRWLRESGYKNHITVITNGAARSHNFWKKLAQIIGTHGRVVFSIDGLEDTNSIYRVGAKWNKVISNVKTFIKYGGRARWDFIVFKHNEHQVDEVIKLAKSLGFEGLFIKKTTRFVGDDHFKGKTNKRFLDFLTKKNTVQRIEPPSKDEYRAKSTLNFEKLIETHGSWLNYVNKTPIDCIWKSKNQLFVDFEAKVWPCCWVADGTNQPDYDDDQIKQIKSIVNHYGNTFNSLRHFTLKEILEHEWFHHKLEESWNGTVQSSPIPKLRVCGRTCGETYEYSSASDSNRKYIEL